MRLINKVLLTLSLCFFAFPLFANNDKQIHFLVLSDIHFDPFLHCTKKPCELIKTLKQAPVTSWPTLLSQQGDKLSTYRQDTNYALLKSSLTAAKEAAKEHQVQFVLVLGDFLGHDYRKLYKKYSQDKTRAGFEAFTKKTMDFIAQELGQAFPNISVYSLPGNNDTYGKDYELEPNGRAFRDFEGAWAPLIQVKGHVAEMQKTFKEVGYYSFLAPNSKLRFIMLNSVLFSSHNKNKNVATYAVKQLNWLKDELSAAKSAQEKVIIAMHIPMGIDVYATLRIKLFTLIQLWQTKYIKTFKSILAEYAPEIKAIFAGHLHADWFQIVTFKDQGHEIPAIGTPAISPLFGNNPGFKIYIYSKEKGALKNFITYYYPLNQHGPWKVEYDFHATYEPECSHCTISQVFLHLKKNPSLGATYRKFYSTSTESQPITKTWLPYWCAMHQFLPRDYRSCLLSNLISFTSTS